MGGVKCHTAEAKSFQHPLPLFSSFSTELTFKLWHQLLCQTRCDFPSLHLPLLPTHAVSAFPSLPLTSPSLSSAPISCLPPSSEPHSQNPSHAGRPCCRWHPGIHHDLGWAGVPTGLHLSPCLCSLFWDTATRKPPLPRPTPLPPHHTVHLHTSLLGQCPSGSFQLPHLPPRGSSRDAPSA
jgi:hypothetical protein